MPAGTTPENGRSALADAATEGRIARAGRLSATRSLFGTAASVLMSAAINARAGCSCGTGRSLEEIAESLQGGRLSPGSRPETCDFARPDPVKKAKAAAWAAAGSSAILIRSGFHIECRVAEPTPLLLMLNIHPSRVPDLRTPHLLTFTPATDARDYTDSFGNTCTRIVAEPGTIGISTSFVVADSGEADRQSPSARAVPVGELPDEALLFLLGSRYCETDKLSAVAWRLFGGLAPGWGMVQDICDFAHKHIRFDYQLADSTRSAADAYDGQVGVCRDYAHLAVALCRCMNIPARYCTGYMGDIGVPLVPPMDFSAWFDVYLDGEWHVFDARNNIPRIGRILMARGRDATDVALTTSFGRAPLHVFEVHSDPVEAVAEA